MSDTAPNYSTLPGLARLLGMDGDRDVGRPLILKSKGWNIFRVWSIDFFHDPEAEYSRIVRLIENAKRKESESTHQ
jgi:very-short-patch-repair endonuclease